MVRGPGEANFKSRRESGSRRVRARRQPIAPSSVWWSADLPCDLRHRRDARLGDCSPHPPRRTSAAQLIPIRSPLLRRRDESGRPRPRRRTPYPPKEAKAEHEQHSFRNFIKFFTKR